MMFQLYIIARLLSSMWAIQQLPGRNFPSNPFVGLHYIEVLASLRFPEVLPDKCAGAQNNYAAVAR